MEHDKNKENTNMKKIAYTLFSCFVMMTVLSASAGNTIIKAKMDSAVLLMGKKTAIHLEIVQNKGEHGRFLNEEAKMLNEFVEVSARPVADTVDLGNNRIQINRDIIIQSFDSGMYVIPEMEYVVGNDTFASNSLTLKVIPVKVDSLTTFSGYKPIEVVPFVFSDLFPEFLVDYWWAVLLIVLILVGALYVYFKWIKQGAIPFVKPAKPEIPPYDEAIMKLSQLKSERLWESGNEKEYFTRLTDILRRYLDRRFAINAMEMTTGQIMQVLRKNEETHAVNDQLSKILEMADFVKFAKMRPLPEDNEVAYNRAVNFVTETKPVEVVTEEGDENSDKSEKQPKAQTAKKEGGKA